MIETWKPIPFAPGYEASDHGRVRSWRGSAGGQKVRTEPLILTPHLSRRYLVHSLCIAGKKVPTPVHKSVAAAFYGPRPEGLEVRHLDGDHLNNALTNLAYGTHAENIADQLAHGTHANAAKIRCAQGHPFAGPNLHIASSGRRVCRTCRADSKRRWLKRRAGAEPLARTG